ncbi:hypothetical protein RSO41_13120 [Halomonas sp. I1]|nr:hypothetical protein [Halomonas sp. I1]MDT8895596.1 hypothetical protein [Halomonas sp. I1]
MTTLAPGALKRDACTASTEAFSGPWRELLLIDGIVKREQDHHMEES